MKNPAIRDSASLLKSKDVRKIWDEHEGKWYFSVVDIIKVLSGRADPSQAARQWTTLKNKLNKEGSDILFKIERRLMESEAGKQQKLEVGDTETIFRIIQSLPSKEAEPFKLWLSRVGFQRVEEAEDPEKAISRAMRTYFKKGYSKRWVDLRLNSMQVRKELVKEWGRRGIRTSDEFSRLTDEITSAWAGMDVEEYKKEKELDDKENLRDNMSNLELIISMLAEASVTEISRSKQPHTFNQNRIVAKEGGEVAGNAKTEIETKTGHPLILKSNFLKEKKKRFLGEKNK